MIYSLIKYYAVARGILKGLQKRPPWTMSDVDRVLRQVYVEPLREMLNQQPLLDFTLWDVTPPDEHISFTQQKED